MLTGMINLRGMGARCAVAIAVGALLTAGCGTDDDSAGGPTSAPSTPREQLLLAQDEFPAGSSKVDLPQDRIDTMSADLAGAGRDATFTPQECTGVQQDLGVAMKELFGRSAVAAASGKSGVMYVEYVTEGVGDLRRIADLNERCAAYTYAASFEGAQINAESTIENRTAPAGLKGVEAIAYRSTSSSSVGGDAPLTMSEYSGIATLRGVTVMVRVTTLSDVADESAFTQLFTAAVDKVRKAA
ncbi:DUF5642 family protein [Nocardia sp. NPDC005366]|uniref:DUF5642 family protein n=1 Tax=Nocardia sp. NPDC005366 TaxID=3156878 RepID=UPI0033A3F6C5